MCKICFMHILSLLNARSITIFSSFLPDYTKKSYCYVTYSNVIALCNYTAEQLLFSFSYHTPGNFLYCHTHFPNQFNGTTSPLLTISITTPSTTLAFSLFFSRGITALLTISFFYVIVFRLTILSPNLESYYTDVHASYIIIFSYSSTFSTSHKLHALLQTNSSTFRRDLPSASTYLLPE